MTGSSKRIAVVGAGALGCALLPRVARMRMEALTVIDGDRVEAPNLHRQELYAEVDLGHFKASTARGWLQMGAPGVEVRAIEQFLDPSNAEVLLSGHGIVADCTDDLHAKSLLDQVCAMLGIALVSGALHEQQGQVLVLHAPGEGMGLSRSGVFTGRIGANQDGCDMRRVPMEAIEAVGARMAQHIHTLLKGEAVVNGTLELYDSKTNHWTAYQTRTA
ncbi:MAG: ThiF family adenylyltransferase [Flavobacteriales bacterium]|nr:ThiF family adenylyltransferase [Flavobacteriales bacterium]